MRFSFVWDPFDPAQSSLAVVTENQRIHFSLPQKLVFSEAAAPFKETVHPKMTIVIMYTRCVFHFKHVCFYPWKTWIIYISYTHVYI